MIVVRIMDSLEVFARKPRILLAAGALAIVLVFLQGWLSLFSQDRIVDSYVYFFGARAMQRGLDLYDGELIKRLGQEAGIEDVYPYMHTPLTAAAFTPLLKLAPLTMHRIMMIGNALWLALVLYLTFRLVRSRHHPLALFLLFALFQIFNGPAVTTMRIGQMNILVLVLLLACLHWHLRQQEALSALALSLAILIKITPAILLFYFLLFSPRRLRFFIWLAAWTVILIVASFPFAPPHYWLEYIPYAEQGPKIPGLHSVWGWLTIHEFGYPALKDLKIWIYLLLTLPLTVLSLIGIRKNAPADRAVYAFSVLLLLSLLVSPVTREHHFLFCLLPFFYFISRHWEQGEIRLALLFAVLTFIVLVRAPAAFLIFRPLGTAVALLMATIPALLSRSVPSVAPVA